MREFLGHKLEKITEGELAGYSHCSVCGYDWQGRPKGECPGVPRYDWGEWPEHLRSATQLRRMGYKVPDTVDGCSWWNMQGQWVWLYDVTKLAK